MEKLANLNNINLNDKLNLVTPENVTFAGTIMYKKGIQEVIVSKIGKKYITVRLYNGKGGWDETQFAIKNNEHRYGQCNRYLTR